MGNGRIGNLASFRSNDGHIEAPDIANSQFDRGLWNSNKDGSDVGYFGTSVKEEQLTIQPVHTVVIAVWSVIIGSGMVKSANLRVFDIVSFVDTDSSRGSSETTTTTGG